MSGQHSSPSQHSLALLALSQDPLAAGVIVKLTISAPPGANPFSKLAFASSKAALLGVGSAGGITFSHCCL
jgi:hypothetical protein